MYHLFIIRFHLCQLLINDNRIIRITIYLLLHQLLDADDGLSRSSGSNVLDKFSLLHSDWCGFWWRHFLNWIFIFVRNVVHISYAFYVSDILVFAAGFDSATLVCHVFVRDVIFQKFWAFHLSYTCSRTISKHSWLRAWSQHLLTPLRLECFSWWPNASLTLINLSGWTQLTLFKFICYLKPKSLSILRMKHHIINSTLHNIISETSITRSHFLIEDLVFSVAMLILDGLQWLCLEFFIINVC